MKGFIYLIEIAIAAILMSVVLSVFFSIRLKQNWERADLITVGINIFNSAKNDKEFIVKILNENLSIIDLNKPENINYNLKITGSPKSKIYIGCYVNCEYLKYLLSYDYGSSVFLNNRWINFSIETFDINSEIPSYYDAIVLINYTGYSNNDIKNRINEYLKNGGVVIGINSTESTDQNFREIFNLTEIPPAASSFLNFSFYEPLKDNIAKYFLGIGMDVYQDSSWYIWEERWYVQFGGNKINLTLATNPLINRTNLKEGDIFSLTGPDSKNYFFKIKKLWPNRADIQILNKSFVFKDFSERNVIGNKILGNPSYAALTTNNSAIWISDFPKSDEYKLLLKSAILSKLDTWSPKAKQTTKEKVTLSYFETLCCDMPETVKLYLTLWYEI